MQYFIFNQISHGVYSERLGSWGRRKMKLERLITNLDPIPSKQEKQIAFYPVNSDGERIQGKNRQRLMVNRFLTRQLKLNDGFFTDKTIRKISDKINERFFPDIEIRLDKGKKITENYRDEVGGHSCMTEENAEFTRLYEMNPDRFEQLVAIYRNDSARAIVSTLDNGKKFCEPQPYGTSEFLRAKLREYRKEKGWDKPLEEELIITGLDFEDGCVPYMDSFYYYRIENKKLNIYATQPNKYDGTLDNQNGYLENSSYCTCCEDSISGGNEYIHNGEIYCEYCYNENFINCQYCEDTIYCEDSILVEDMLICETCYKNETTECNNCNEIYFDDNMTEVQNNLLCTGCTEECIYCKNCDELFPPDEIEDDLCEDCLEEKEKNQLKLFEEE
jgi:hypothetical protein